MTKLNKKQVKNLVILAVLLIPIGVCCYTWEYFDKHLVACKWHSPISILAAISLLIIFCWILSKIK